MDNDDGYHCSMNRTYMNPILTYNRSMLRVFYSIVEEVLASNDVM